MPIIDVVSVILRAFLQVYPHDHFCAAEGIGGVFTPKSGGSPVCRANGYSGGGSF
jgi:hypothetical protein